MVEENINYHGMDPTEVLSDGVETLTLQNVDISGITLPFQTNPVIQSLYRIKELLKCSPDARLIGALFGLVCLCDENGNRAVAERNGVVELMCEVCQVCRRCWGWTLRVSALTALALFIRDIKSTEMFWQRGGPKMVVGILNDAIEDVKVLDSGFAVVAAAATGNEVIKESFVELHIDELIVNVMRKHGKAIIPSLYDAIRVLLAADDNRVVASQVFGYARRFAKIGIAEALVESLKRGLSLPFLASATVALKAIAVNDDICRSIAENGGIDSLLVCIDHAGLLSKIEAKACCSLLSKLAESDFNKSAIVERGGLNRLITLSSRLADDPSVIQEVMTTICTLCLRSPGNATLAIEAGAGDLAIQSMQTFPEAYQLQKNSCLMIRNLVARNPENRTLLLGNGIEKIIRKAKENHKSCKDAATTALRDLGLDNYNS